MWDFTSIFMMIQSLIKLAQHCHIMPTLPAAVSVCVCVLRFTQQRPASIVDHANVGSDMAYGIPLVLTNIHEDTSESNPSVHELATTNPYTVQSNCHGSLVQSKAQPYTVRPLNVSETK